MSTSSFQKWTSQSAVLLKSLQASFVMLDLSSNQGWYVLYPSGWRMVGCILIAGWMPARRYEKR